MIAILSIMKQHFELHMPNTGVKGWQMAGGMHTALTSHCSFTPPVLLAFVITVRTILFAYEFMIT